MLCIYCDEVLADVTGNVCRPCEWANVDPTSEPVCFYVGRKIAGAKFVYTVTTNEGKSIAFLSEPAVMLVRSFKATTN